MNRTVPTAAQAKARLREVGLSPTGWKSYLRGWLQVAMRDGRQAKRAGLDLI